MKKIASFSPLNSALSAIASAKRDLIITQVQVLCVFKFFIFTPQYLYLCYTQQLSFLFLIDGCTVYYVLAMV